MSDRKVSPEDIFSRGVCSEPIYSMTSDEIMALFAGREELSATEVLDTHLPWQRRLWVALHPTALTEVELMACALEFARDAIVAHESDLPDPAIFRGALAVYESWLQGNASNEERDAAQIAAAKLCRHSIRTALNKNALAAGWAIAGAGLPRSFHAARMAAYFGRLAAKDSVKASKRQVDLVRNMLECGVAARYRQDVAETELTARALAPLDNSLTCKVTLTNATSAYLQAGKLHTPHGDSSFLVDAIPANSGPTAAVRGVGKTCAESGTTGTASFLFGDNQSLVLSWNIPYTLSCLGDGIVPYFYAFLQGPQPGQYQVDVGNIDLDMCLPPPACDQSYTAQISPVVTLSNIS